MKKTLKILGCIFLIYILIFSSLVLGRIETLDHGTNSIVNYDDMNNLTDRTLTINWSNNFTGYGGTSDAEVVIAIYVPVDYGVNSMNNVTINDIVQFEVNNVSDGNCLDGMWVNTTNGSLVWVDGLNVVANETIWSTNCTLIVINGTLQNPAGGFNLTINITISDSCANTECVNETYQLMFSDLITYKKEVGIPDSCKYDSSLNTTFCYKVDDSINYSCNNNRSGDQSGNIPTSCNITKGIGSMYNETNMSIIDMGVPGGKRVTVPEEEFVIQLYNGWNLFSIPLQPKNDSLESVLAPINGKYTAVYEWNADIDSDYYGWVKHTNAINDLTILKPSVGYWIYCNEDVNLTVKGTLNDVSLNLFTGWNMFGWKWKSLGNKELTSALSPISGNYTAVYEWNADINSDYYGWVKHTNAINDLTILNPGVGYWIYMQNNKML